MLTLRSSLIRRLSDTLTGAVTAIVFVFSGLVMVYNITAIESRLEQQLDRTVELAKHRLASVVWQLPPSSISDVLQAIFVDAELSPSCSYPYHLPQLGKGTHGIENDV